MRKNGLGRFTESIDINYLLNTHELESYRDQKINSYDILFPESTERLNGEVHIWNLNDKK